MRHRITRDRNGQFALAITVNAAVFGGLGVLGMALSPLPATQIRDLVSPPAASASIPTRPLSVLPGMGAGLELVRWPRGLDVHTVPWSAGAAHRPVHLNFEGGDSTERHIERHGYVGRHRAESIHVQHERRHCSGVDAPGLRGGHPHGDNGPRSGGREGGHGHHDSGGNQHHRHDGNVGEHHQGSHSHGGHHAEHGGGGRHGR